MKEHLKSLGYTNVYNKNEDFYQCIKENTIPSYDILISNPAWSNNHIEKCFQFCKASNKPYLLLIPNFCYMKDWYMKLYKHGELYITPLTRYRFLTPLGYRDIKTKERRTSPFITFWYSNVKNWPKSMISFFNKESRKRYKKRIK